MMDEYTWEIKNLSEIAEWNMNPFEIEMYGEYVPETEEGGYIDFF